MRASRSTACREVWVFLALISEHLALVHADCVQRVGVLAGPGQRQPHPLVAAVLGGGLPGTLDVAFVSQDLDQGTRCGRGARGRVVLNDVRDAGSQRLGLPGAVEEAVKPLAGPGLCLVVASRLPQGLCDLQVPVGGLQIVAADSISSSGSPLASTTPTIASRTVNRSGDHPSASSCSSRQRGSTSCWYSASPSDPSTPA